MPKRPCSVCGKLLAVSAKSLASPTCQGCRKATKPNAPKWKRVRVDHANCDGTCANSKHVPCSGTCGRGMWISTTSADSPMCRDCRLAQRLADGGVVVDGLWHYEKLCDNCGDPFPGQSRRSRFCSKTCSQAVVSGRLHPYADQRERNRMKCHRRRARLNGAFVEDVVPSEVYRRDGWVCQLCYEKVDKRLDGNHMWGPTLDHIITIADGGEHSYANTQLAHRRCNISKGARSAGQTKLI